MVGKSNDGKGGEDVGRKKGKKWGQKGRGRDRRRVGR